jgi:hypothetical protein
MYTEKIRDAEHIDEFMNEHENKASSDSVDDPLFEGLKIFREIKPEGYIEYATEHDKFYGAGLNDLPGITEMHVYRLMCLGWFWDEECFCMFV